MIADADDDLDLEAEELEDDPDASPEPDADEPDDEQEDADDEDTPDSAADEDSELPGDDSADTEDDHRGRFQKRIDELVGQRKEADERGDQLAQENRELRDRLEAIEARLPKAPELTAPKRPRLEDFETDDEYEQALDQYMDERLEFKLAERAKKESDAAAQEEADRRERQQAERAEKRVGWLQQANLDSPGIIARAQALPALTEHSADVVTGMDVADGIKVIEYLEANPKQAVAIASLEPDEQESILMEIGTGKPSGSGKNVTKAPRPTKPTSGRRKAPQKDINKMSQAEFEAHRDAGGT